MNGSVCTVKLSVSQTKAFSIQARFSSVEPTVVEPDQPILQTNGQMGARFTQDDSGDSDTISIRNRFIEEEGAFWKEECPLT